MRTHTVHAPAESLRLNDSLSWGSIGSVLRSTCVVPETADQKVRLGRGENYHEHVRSLRYVSLGRVGPRVPPRMGQ